MIEIKAIRYFVYGRYRTVLAAWERVQDLKERHPEREYTILVNARAGGWRAFQVAQIAHEKVEILEPQRDFPFPEEPKRADFPNQEQYSEAYVAYHADLKRHQGDYTEILRRPMNK